jgi:hypothetical protein
MDPGSSPSLNERLTKSGQQLIVTAWLKPGSYGDGVDDKGADSNGARGKGTTLDGATVDVAGG